MKTRGNYGFDHIAIATGAGRPTIVKMKNNLIRGIRQASDFLMALQLTGAFKKDTLSNLQVRLPAVVIGGGLTGIDTATELFAYYPVQVEKTLGKFEEIAEEIGEEEVWKQFDEEEKKVLAEFLVHGKAIREERARAVEARRIAGFCFVSEKMGRCFTRLQKAAAGFACISFESRRSSKSTRRRNRLCRIDDSDRSSSG